MPEDTEQSSIAGIKLEAALLCLMLGTESKKAAEAARAYALSILNMPDEQIEQLRDQPQQHQRKGRPLQYDAPKVPEGYFIQGLKGGSFVSARKLADFYADLFTDLAKHDALPPSEVDRARLELDPFGWALFNDKKGNFWPVEKEKPDKQTQLNPVKAVGGVSTYARTPDQEPEEPEVWEMLRTIHGSDAGHRVRNLAHIVQTAAKKAKQGRQRLHRAALKILIVLPLGEPGNLHGKSHFDLREMICRMGGNPSVIERKHMPDGHESLPWGERESLLRHALLRGIEEA